MQRLGYRRWVAQGRDWGAAVTTALGHLLPAGLAGIHLLGDGYDYLRQQSTPPQAIEYYEKFYSRTDNNGSVEDALSRELMLDNISLYWFTNTAASSARISWENEDASLSGGKLSLPVAATVFPREIHHAPKGHFAAFLEPDIFVEEMRSAFRTLREQ